MKNVKLMMLLALSAMTATAVYAMNDMDDEAVSMQDQVEQQDQAEQDDVSWWQWFKNGLSKTGEYVAYPFKKTYQGITYPVRQVRDWYYGPTEEPVVEPSEEDEGISMPEDEQMRVMRQVRNDSEDLLKLAIQQDADMTRYTHGVVTALREGNKTLAIELLKAGLAFIQEKRSDGFNKDAYDICEAEFMDMLDSLNS